MRSHAALPCLLGALLSFSGSGASGNGDTCTSTGFREAFLEGRESEDYPSVSPVLIGYGDRAIPCLKSIVAGKAERLGITACAGDPYPCKSRALGVIGMIGTPAAKKYLIGFLRSPNNPRLLEGAALSLANLRAEEARPALLALLKHTDTKLRATAILSLGVIGNRSDFDAMLAATLALPPNEIYRGAVGLQKLGDPRAIQPLENRLKTTTDPAEQRAIEDVLRQFKTKP